MRNFGKIVSGHRIPVLLVYSMDGLVYYRYSSGELLGEASLSGGIKQNVCRVRYLVWDMP